MTTKTKLRMIKREKFERFNRKSWDLFRHNNTNYDDMWKSGKYDYKDIIEDLGVIVKKCQPKFSMVYIEWKYEKLRDPRNQ